MLSLLVNFYIFLLAVAPDSCDRLIFFHLLPMKNYASKGILTQVKLDLVCTEICLAIEQTLNIINSIPFLIS